MSISHACAGAAQMNFVPQELQKKKVGYAKKKLINRQCYHIEYPPHLRTECAGQDYVKSVGKK